MASSSWSSLFRASKWRYGCTSWGVPGVDPLNVVILGGGVVGAHAAHMAVGMGADVWVLDNNPDTLEQHWQQFGRSTILSSLQKVQ